MERLLSYKASIPKNFNIEHNTSRGYTMENYHFHDVFEIYYALSTSNDITYFVEDTIYPIKKGDVFIFNNMDLHKTVVPRNVVYDRYIITFTPEYVQGISTPSTDLLECFMNRGCNFSHRIYSEEIVNYNLLPLINKLEYYHKNDSYGSDVYKKITLAEILLIINKACNNNKNIHQPLNDIKNTHSKIRPILKYIHENLEKDLSLQHLASHFYMNKYHMGDVFKKATGFTIYNYIITRRIIKARELLKKNMPVSEVAESIGFNDYSHFIRSFKKLVGVSPKRYAKLSS